VKQGDLRKPEEPHPANPDQGVSGSGAVGLSPRIYWARTVPPPELAHRLALHLRDENCPHVALRHCAICVEGHLVDLIAHLVGEADPGPS